MLELGGAVVSVLDRSAVKTYDYINQVNASVVDLQGYVDNTLPLSLLCITMILRVLRNFFLNYYETQQWHQSQVYA